MVNSLLYKCLLPWPTLRSALSAKIENKSWILSRLQSLLQRMSYFFRFARYDLYCSLDINIYSWCSREIVLICNSLADLDASTHKLLTNGRPCPWYGCVRLIRVRLQRDINRIMDTQPILDTYHSIRSEQKQC